MESGIYYITNTGNNQIYVGSTKNFSRRFREHRIDLNNNKHFNIHLQRSWSTYGESCFIFSIVERCSEDILLEREQFHIDKNIDNGIDIYNINLIAELPPMGMAVHPYPELINENGEIIEAGIGITKIAEKMGINMSALSALINGKTKVCYGWMLKSEAKFNDLSGKWEVDRWVEFTKEYPEIINANGERIKGGSNISKLCRDLKILPQNMIKMFLGKSRSCYGWMIASDAYFDSESGKWKVDGLLDYGNPEFINANGEIIPESENLRKTCVEFGLNYKQMNALKRGKNKTCHGWMIKENTYFSEQNKKWYLREYNPTFINHNTKEIFESGYRLREMCDIYGINISVIKGVISGIYKQCKGWELHL